MSKIIPFNEALVALHSSLLQSYGSEPSLKKAHAAHSFDMCSASDRAQRVYINLELDDVWGASASITLKFEKVTVKKTFECVLMDTSIDWSATERTLGGAIVAVGVYQKAIQVASHLQAMWASMGMVTPPTDMH